MGMVWNRGSSTWQLKAANCRLSWPMSTMRPEKSLAAVAIANH